jgi:hypothetical protein
MKEAIMNLEQQKKQARELLRAIRAGSADALTRLRGEHLRWANLDDATVQRELALHDAQFVIAREQGFSSWTKLKAYAEPSSPTCSGSPTGFTAFCEPGSLEAQPHWNRFANGIRAFTAARMKKFDRRHSWKQMPSLSMRGSMASILGMIWPVG